MKKCYQKFTKKSSINNFYISLFHPQNVPQREYAHQQLLPKILTNIIYLRVNTKYESAKFECNRIFHTPATWCWQNFILKTISFNPFLALGHMALFSDVNFLQVSSLYLTY